MDLYGDDHQEVPTAVVDAKVAEYEEFIEKVLKVKLQSALAEYRKDATVLDQCRELRENIDMLCRDKVPELESMVELGCQFYSKAFVPDTSRIFINVGLGFHLEMPLQDAGDFLEHKEKHLVGALGHRKEKISKIKADIHEALHLIDLMMQVRSGGTPWWDACASGLSEAFAC
eukprot:TRINITY_DN5475_c0_g1_i1.p1 TRINITY_DN5475_c0_g1~~TRINITY_DN5475_c0_g1_i1.p1  ORF type:complete len:173 (+),score=34.63 TRINITY_DN5475_c0_g1_i1:72-590(+)